MCIRDSIQTYLSNYNNISEEQVRIADVNKDGKVDVNDVTALQTILSGETE